MPKRFLAICHSEVGLPILGEVMRKHLTRKNVLGWTQLFLLRPHLVSITSSWGDENCVFGGVKIARKCDIYFLRAVSGLRAFCKMPPNILFCSLFLALPVVRVGGFYVLTLDPKARSKTEMGLQGLYTFYLLSLLLVYSPSICFSGWVGCFVSLFDIWKIYKEVGARIALF